MDQMEVGQNSFDSHREARTVQSYAPWYMQRKYQIIAGLAVVVVVAGGLVATFTVGGGTTTTTTTMTTTMTTTTTTTLYKWPTNNLECKDGGDIQKCVDFLNEQYLGFDENNPASPLGVTIRGRANYGAWMWCGGGCYDGNPDCYVAAAVMNSKVMICQDGGPNPCVGTAGAPAMPFNDPVGIIFQPNAIENVITKCSWDVDGSADQRINGGCGNAPLQGRTCAAGTNSAYNGTCCMQPGKDCHPIVDNWNCPGVAGDDCENIDGNCFDGGCLCFQKGPAFYSDPRPTALGNFPANITQGPIGGIRKSLQQRINVQNINGCVGGVPCEQVNDEITIDGKVLTYMLKSSPQAAIAGIMYSKGNGRARDIANKLNNDLQKDWNFKVPLIAMDLMQDLRSSTGPFSKPESFEDFEDAAVV